MTDGTSDRSLVCVGNLTIDEARYGGERGRPALGGDAAYAALAARLFTENVRMLAPVGHDVPQELLSALATAGVGADHLPERDSATIRNIITYHADGTRTWDMLSTEEDFDLMSVYPVDVPRAALGADGIVLLAMSLASQLALTPWLKKNSGARLYLDLQEDYLEGNRESINAMISCCDVFLPSEVEAVALTGTTDLVAAAQQFRGLGPRTVVIKRAERGSLVVEEGRVLEVPTEPVPAIDSTGAGDAFCGAFAAVHLRTGDAATAARAGATAARVAISAYGVDALVSAAQQVERSGQMFGPGAGDGGVGR
ncbi:carbohydrate kinase family protein [Phycicoccus sp. Root101]|uniref:carbohydrate kinase family protein n=1 Tax=Phycicoccus sp. Root101 TaxID=1736421 RepID=UPI000702FF01|nr:carbohydrate kinase family protein [Phycicoccus sp. Root101]KQU68916.1 hypothetical protein ASC58_09645 [Phycicoccus sp. Root101]